VTGSIDTFFMGGYWNIECVEEAGSMQSRDMPILLNINKETSKCGTKSTEMLVDRTCYHVLLQKVDFV